MFYCIISYCLSEKFLGSGGGIHGRAKICWSKHDTASTVCYSQVVLLVRSLILLVFCMHMFILSRWKKYNNCESLSCFSALNYRNERGREMLNLVRNLFEITPTTTSVKSATLFYYCFLKLWCIRLFNFNHFPFY